MIMLKILRQRGYLELFGWDTSNHKGPCKTKAGGSGK